MRTGCTTCGSLEYRSAVVRGALKAIGEDTTQYLEGRGRKLLRPTYRDLPLELRTRVMKETAIALRDIEQGGIFWDGISFLLVELDNHYTPSLDEQSLDDILKGTAVGETLASMRNYEAQLVSKNKQRRETELQNKLLKKEKRKANLLIHRAAPKKTSEQRIKEGGEVIHVFLRSVTNASPEDILVTIKNSKDPHVLDKLPKNLIPTNFNQGVISVDTRKYIVKLIDKRRGRWANLRRQLSQGLPK